MKNSQLQIRISDTLRKTLEEKADRLGVTVSDYVRALIIQDIKQDLRDTAEPEA